MPRLNNRSHGSVELKHQNISAVLIEMGMPYISGYKPRVNYQRSLLPAVVGEHLSRNPQLQQLFEQNCHEMPSGTKCWRHSSSSRRDACVLQVKSNDSCGEREPLLVGQSGLFGA